MAARRWFTAENSQIGYCEPADLAIMNRAVRHLAISRAVTASLLSTVRTAYAPGMSSAELVHKVAKLLGVAT